MRGKQRGQVCRCVGTPRELIEGINQQAVCSRLIYIVAFSIIYLHQLQKLTSLMASEALTVGNIGGLRVVDLKGELKSRGLATDGKKVG